MLECTALIMADHMFDARPVIRKTYYIKQRQLSEAKKTVTLIVSASNKQETKNGWKRILLYREQ